MDFKRLIVYIVLAVLVLNGCEIEELSSSGSTPVGSLYVTAFDQDEQELAGCAIKIDRVVQPGYATPAYIHEIAEGEHEIIVSKFGYFSDTTYTSVEAGDTSLVESALSLVPADQTGKVFIDSDPQGAKVLLNGEKFIVEGAAALTPAELDLPWGVYNLSVYLENHSIVNPLNPNLQLQAGDSLTFTLQLEPGTTGNQAGNLPIPFTLLNLLGDSISITDLTGYIVLINFWFIDCPPCQEEFPDIESVYRAKYDEGFRVLAINRMLRDDIESIEAFGQDLDLTFEILLDNNMQTTAAYGVRSFPHNVIVDRTGEIHAILPKIERDELTEIVESLLQRTED